MPIKRRVGKSNRLDEWKLYELQHGPGSCLLAGTGYHYSIVDGPRDLTDDERAGMLATMREDWERHRADVLATWTLASLPWAAAQFDDEGNPHG